MAAITAFRPGETKRFKITLKIDGVAQNITADTVTFRLKAKSDDPDDAALVTVNADVATSGASGIAIFEIMPAATHRRMPGIEYHCDIVWAIDSSTRRFVAHTQTLTLLERVSDSANNIPGA